MHNNTRKIQRISVTELIIAITDCKILFHTVCRYNLNLHDLTTNPRVNSLIWRIHFWMPWNNHFTFLISHIVKGRQARACYQKKCSWKTTHPALTSNCLPRIQYIRQRVRRVTSCLTHFVHAQPHLVAFVSVFTVSTRSLKHTSSEPQSFVKGF